MRYVLALVLLAVVIFVGWPNLAAPWIQGDEYLFIANNPDVTGVGRGEPAALRWLAIFRHAHGDLYQPIPIVTYAIEWSLWGDSSRVRMMRLTDVLLHGVNALLLWGVFTTLLRRFVSLDTRFASLLGWALALLWALHPTLAAAYAADMGRTHLLSALFLLLSLRLHIAAVEASDRRRLGYFGLSLLCVVLAMMSKTVAGWFLVVLAIEWAWIGGSAALRSPRIYLVTAACVGFALLTLLTSRASGILEDAELALFGNPITRSLVGIWLYALHTLLPVNLATWYPPDIRTSWSYWATWAGLGLLAGSLVAAAFAAASRRWASAVGIVWFWATLLPLLGIVGARVAAAQDRYLYLPLMGLLLAAGGVLARWGAVAHGTPGVGVARDRAEDSPAPIGSRGALTSSRRGLAIGIPVVLAAAMAFETRPLVGDARDMMARAQRVIRGDPTDPRRIEFVAMHLDFSMRHGLPIPDAENTKPANAFLYTLAQAAAAAEQHSQYFRDAGDRAAFHRRISYQLLDQQLPNESLQQAERAASFEPDAPYTLTRLAHAYRALGRWDDALRAYARLEAVMPENPPFRALRFTEFGDLLLYVFDAPQEAAARYRAALDTHVAPWRAAVGLARCEVLAGKGVEGFRIATHVLSSEPENVDALVVVALYHTRSRHWKEAADGYRQVLRRDPTHYEALRGFQEVCAQLDDLRDAQLAWQDARRLEPGNPVFAAFAVWAAACANDDSAGAQADQLLQADSNSRFGCLTHMLIAVRAGRFDEAIEWVERAGTGAALPGARELERAETTLRLLEERKEVGTAAVLVRAALWAALGNAVTAKELATRFAADEPSSEWRELALRLGNTPASAESTP